MNYVLLYTDRIAICYRFIVDRIGEKIEMNSSIPDNIRQTVEGQRDEEIDVNTDSALSNEFTDRWNTRQTHRNSNALIYQMIILLTSGRIHCTYMYLNGTSTHRWRTHKLFNDYYWECHDICDSVGILNVPTLQLLNSAKIVRIRIFHSGMLRLDMTSQVYSYLHVKTHFRTGSHWWNANLNPIEHAQCFRVRICKQRWNNSDRRRRARVFCGCREYRVTSLINWNIAGSACSEKCKVVCLPSTLLWVSAMGFVKSCSDYAFVMDIIVCRPIREFHFNTVKISNYLSTAMLSGMFWTMARPRILRWRVNGYINFYCKIDKYN